MGILERIKKKQLEGFREFVMSLETTSPQSRGQIFTSGVLEDPMYMSWVMKNIRSFEDFMKLPPDEIEKVIASQESMVNVFVRALDENTNPSQSLETVVPKLISKIRDELEYLKDVTPEVKISARSQIMKVARNLQNTQLIMGFRWQLPPMEVFYPKIYKDGLTEICFESGVVAAKGIMEKNKRVGPWVHYYDSGRMLAQGEYLDGLKEENWIFYYSNGKERAKGKFFFDQRHGIWSEWDREGVLAEVEYKEGVKS